MNLVILQVTGEKAVALAGDGQFIHLKARRGMMPGCEFMLEEPARPRAVKSISAVAAAFLLLVMSAAMWQAFAVATRIDIEINPAVRMNVNALGLVIRTEALNDDGRALLAGMRASPFARAEETAARIIGRAVDGGYLKPEGSVSITVEDADPARAHTKEAALQNAAADVLRARHVKATVRTRAERPGAPKEPAAEGPAHNGDDRPKPRDSDATPAPESAAPPRGNGKDRDAKPGRPQPGPKETEGARDDGKGGNTGRPGREGTPKPERTKKPDSKADPGRGGDKGKNGRSRAASAHVRRA